MEKLLSPRTLHKRRVFFVDYTNITWVKLCTSYPNIFSMYWSTTPLFFQEDVFRETVSRMIVWRRNTFATKSWQENLESALGMSVEGRCWIFSLAPTAGDVCKKWCAAWNFGKPIILKTATFVRLKRRLKWLLQNCTSGNSTCQLFDFHQDVLCGRSAARIFFWFW